MAALASTQARINEALKSPTLDGAIESYGRTWPAFLRALREAGRVDEVRTKYAADFTARTEAQAVRTAKIIGDKNRAAGEIRRAALVEDAEFLVRNGEHPENAAKRLGYNNFQALARALERANRTDLITGLYRNDRAGWGPVADRAWK